MQQLGYMFPPSCGIIFIFWHSYIVHTSLVSIPPEQSFILSLSHFLLLLWTLPIRGRSQLRIKKSISFPFFYSFVYEQYIKILFVVHIHIIFSFRQNDRFIFSIILWFIIFELLIYLLSLISQFFHEHFFTDCHKSERIVTFFLYCPSANWKYLPSFQLNIVYLQSFSILQQLLYNVNYVTKPLEGIVITRNYTCWNL